MKKKIKNTLVLDRRYAGKYVALRDFNNRRIAASDKDPLRAMKKAEEKGVKNPLVVFVPKPGTTYIYNAA